MRSSTVSMIVAGVLVGVVGAVLAVYAFINGAEGKPWFFWIAPFLALGFALVMIQLVVQYWFKVGKLELRGRPRK